jgi:hypothetical protein
VGKEVGFEMVGNFEGVCEGLETVGIWLGEIDGDFEGGIIGKLEGLREGLLIDGNLEGIEVEGVSVGEKLGECEG